MRCVPVAPLCQESFRFPPRREAKRLKHRDYSEKTVREEPMQELKRLQTIVIACVVGVVFSFGGAVYTAVKTSREKKALELPANQIPVPATVN